MGHFGREGCKTRITPLLLGVKTKDSYRLWSHKPYLTSQLSHKSKSPLRYVSLLSLYHLIIWFSMLPTSILKEVSLCPPPPFFRNNSYLYNFEVSHLE